MSLKLHGHPQKEFYIDPSEWIRFSVQGHWAPGENPVKPSATPPIIFDISQGMLGNSILSHTHFDLTSPIYAEVAEAFVCDFSILLFHTTGKAIFELQYQEGIKNIFWNSTGSSVPPLMIGNPNGIAEWTGKITLDPTIKTRWYTLHGWWSPLISVTTLFDNKDINNIRVIVPFFSMLNPSAPETQGSPTLSARTAPVSSRHPTISWGDNLVETSQYIPIAPIDKTWSNFMITAGYGAKGLPPANFQQRADLDLHNHVGGILIKNIVQDSDINTNVEFNPVQLGTGTHKMALLRNQLSLDSLETVNTLLVFNVKVGNAPPPAVVTIPNVNGLEVSIARTALTSIGLVIGSQTSTNNVASKGIVISQKPIAGESVPIGTSVDLVVSLGPLVTEEWRLVIPEFQQLFIDGVPQERYRICTLIVCKEI